MEEFATPKFPHEALSCLTANIGLNIHGYMEVCCDQTSRTCDYRYACMAFKRAVNRTENTKRGDSKRTVDRLVDAGKTPFYHVQGRGKPMILRPKNPGRSWAGVKGG